MAETKITKDEILDRTRRVPMQLTAGTGTGVAFTADQGPRVNFTGTPSEFARASTILPMDYVPGSAVTITILVETTNTQSISYLHYVAAVRAGVTTAIWNIINGGTIAAGSTPSGTCSTLAIACGSTGFQPGDKIAFAAMPNAAVTGTIYISMVYLDYTADN